MADIDLSGFIEPFCVRHLDDPKCASYNVDTDAGGLLDAVDNCPVTPDPGQDDQDGDGLGDLCDACPVDAANDMDGDGICAGADNCPGTANAGQENQDGDTRGDACDVCPNDLDDDADGDGDACDISPQGSNPGNGGGHGGSGGGIACFISTAEGDEGDAHEK